ncbi:hypothetical protein EV356DRAFT_109915 [Viridothelium virens]|uniref:Heterokaryon incompatibility domain-containing protein n=1 Tax=Viridothelium virens TaxID=1048519 RepID=A0A6A6HPI3_VIRVR|nr:hypothetical protein EV356DRAFT_109915 [Viridothelium virens]
MEVMLWADAICINQDDLDERSHQVSMMGLIYSKAKGVIAWLGESNKESDLALDSAEYWAPFMRHITDSMPDQVINGIIVEEAEKEVPLAFDPSARQALGNFSTRPYWTRVWIVQELLLARQVDVRCGERVLNIDQLRDAIAGRTASDAAQAAGDGPNHLQSQASLELQASPMFNMLMRTRSSPEPAHLEKLPQEAVADISNLDATDARDKVFALLGLVSSEAPRYDLIRPDYTKSLEQVYQDFARYSITMDRTLEVLRIAGRTFHSANTLESLPTWVPNWKDHNHANTGLPLQDPPSANDILLDLVDFSTDGRVLLARGFEIERVDKVYPYGLFPFWTLKSEYGGKSDYPSFANDILKGRVVNGETSLCAYFRLVGIDRRNGEDQEIKVRDNFFRLAARFLRVLFEEMRNQGVFPAGSLAAQQMDILPFTLTLMFLGVEAPLEDRERLVDLILNEDLDQERFFMPAIHLRTQNYLPFRTASGKLGLGPMTLEDGDELCHLAPHPLPFALRPTDGHQVNVGECFVLDLDLPEVEAELIPYMRQFEIH